jgi:hypothetical protein
LENCQRTRKNIGSNFILKDKKFQFSLKIGWRALASGELTRTFFQLAERGGFEPPVSCPTPVFETGTFNRSVTSPFSYSKTKVIIAFLSKAMIYTYFLIKKVK